MRASLRLAVCGFVVLTAGPAFAQPSAAERALARSLFDEGRTLAKDDRTAEACPKFEESQRLDPGIGTMFNLGDCYEKIGRTASAWSAFADAADRAKIAGQADRERVARERAAALVPRLSRVKLEMDRPLPSGLELRIDGKAVSEAVLGSETPIDPGQHVIRASAPGRLPHETELVVAPTPELVVLRLPSLAAIPPAVAVADVTPAPMPPADSPVGPPAPSPDASKSTWQKPLAIGAGALGIAALGAGSVFGLMASSDWSDAKASCPGDVCSSAGRAGWEDARSSATVSTIAFTAGAVLVAAAVVLWVTAPSERQSSAAARATWRMP